MEDAKTPDFVDPSLDSATDLPVTPSQEPPPSNIAYISKTSNRVELCSFNCTDEAFATCLICKRSFCKHHASKNDLSLCFDCAADPTDAVVVETKIEPLVDDEGVTHTGRHIIPVNNTYIVTEYIDRLTDDELKAQVLAYQQKIKEAEQLLYSRVIVESTLRNNLEDRVKKKRVQDKAARIVRDATGSKTVVLPGANVRQRSASAAPTLNADMFKNMAAGMTPEQKAAMKAKLQAILNSTK